MAGCTLYKQPLKLDSKHKKLYTVQHGEQAGQSAEEAGQYASGSGQVALDEYIKKPEKARKMSAR